METKRNLIIITLLSVLNLILSVVFILRLPDIIPAHFDVELKCNREGSKWECLITAIMPFFAAVIILINAKFSKNGKRNEKSVTLLGFIFFALYTFVNWVYLLLANSGTKLGENLRITGIMWIVCIAFGLAFIIIGNITPTIKQNKFFGVRIKCTLENEDCWRVTHRFYGRFTFIGGIIFTAVSVLLMMSGTSEIVGMLLLLFFVAASTAITTVYAYNHSNSDDKNNK